MLQISLCQSIHGKIQILNFQKKLMAVLRLEMTASGTETAVAGSETPVYGQLHLGAKLNIKSHMNGNISKQSEAVRPSKNVQFL